MSIVPALPSLQVYPFSLSDDTSLQYAVKFKSCPPLQPLSPSSHPWSLTHGELVRRTPRLSNLSPLDHPSLLPEFTALVSSCLDNSKRPAKGHHPAALPSPHIPSGAGFSVSRQASRVPLQTLVSCYLHNFGQSFQLLSTCPHVRWDRAPSSQE